MPTTRNELEAFIKPHAGWDSPHKDEADELLHQLTLLYTIRRNIAHLLKQAETYGGIKSAPVYVRNSLESAWKNNREIRTRYTTLALRYRRLFPGLDTEVATIPEDFSQIVDDPRL